MPERYPLSGPHMSAKGRRSNRASMVFARLRASWSFVPLSVLCSIIVGCHRLGIVAAAPWSDAQRGHFPSSSPPQHARSTWRLSLLGCLTLEHVVRQTDDVHADSQISERQKLLADMKAGVEAMTTGFGEEHPLCQKSAIILQAASDASDAALAEISSMPPTAS